MYRFFQLRPTVEEYWPPLLTETFFAVNFLDVALTGMGFTKGLVEGNLLLSSIGISTFYELLVAKLIFCFLIYVPLRTFGWADILKMVTFGVLVICFWNVYMLVSNWDMEFHRCGGIEFMGDDPSWLEDIDWNDPDTFYYPGVH